ncbi:MAG TPA: tRNA uridine-5-carboxymethylaminomethyl(34) synthesis GTPase MnmE [Gammaproteobacteria bacterium]
MPVSAGTLDTIAAVATPAGRGGIGVVRLSGPRAAEFASGVVSPLPAPRRAVFRRFHDRNGGVIDEGLLLYFPAPNSFTGEDVIEFQGHGGPVVLDLLMQRLLELGARVARPGEFTERAFLNDRMDLAQAEAVADLIDAGSAQAARAALRSLHGEFSARIHELVEALVQTRMYVEAAIDFPEEEVDFLSDAALSARLADVRRRFDILRAKAQQGRLLHDGLTVVIAGPPNAGKSSLLNALAGTDAAIVTDIPGTTRDVLRERIQLDGLPLHVIDTAGLRESTDAVEAEGVRRARAEFERADRLLLVVDSATANPAIPELAELPPGLPVTIVRNKIDLSGEREGIAEEDGRAVIRLSVKTGNGLEILKTHLKEAAGFQAQGSDVFIARRRHLDALARARNHVEQGAMALETARAGELLAEELRLAQQALNEITGEFSSDDLLGRIFSSFCIGK